MHTETSVHRGQYDACAPKGVKRPGSGAARGVARHPSAAGNQEQALPWSEEKATQRADGKLEGVEQEACGRTGGTGVCQKRGEL